MWTPDEQRAELVQAMKEAHVQAVRMPIRWTTVEPEREKWDFKKADRVVQALGEAKIEVLGLLMSVPSWASGASPKRSRDSTMPCRLDRWKTGRSMFARLCAATRKTFTTGKSGTRKTGRILYKPLPNAREYVGLLKAAHDAIKALDPKATVVLGGLQMNGVIPNPWSLVKVENFLQKVYGYAGRGPYFDVANIHPYVLATKEEGPVYAARLVKDTLRVMAKNGDAHKPLWVTETGIATGTTVTEQMQAQHLSGMYQEGDDSRR